MRTSDKPLWASPHFLPAQGCSGTSHTAFSPSETFPTSFQTSLCSETGQQLLPLPSAQPSTISSLPPSVSIHPSSFTVGALLQEPRHCRVLMQTENSSAQVLHLMRWSLIKTQQGRQGAKSGSIWWEKSNPGTRQPPDATVFPYLGRGERCWPPRAMPPDRQMKGVV